MVGFVLDLVRTLYILSYQVSVMFLCFDSIRVPVQISGEL